jgi:hypothetical protein
MTKRGRFGCGGREIADLAVGNWPRTLIGAAVILGAFGVAIALVARHPDLGRASFPGHPYPPAGYERNPFGASADDLVSSAEAARVKADFQRDGQTELDAFALGDASLLMQADAGGRLATLQRVIDQNNRASFVQRYMNEVDSVVVGRQAIAGSSTVAWSVEEKGSAIVSDIAKGDGRELHRQSYRFDGRYWLTKAGDRYLITDAAISNTPLTGR